MRVTTGHSLRLLQEGTAAASREIERLSQVLSSGRTLTRPSDNPVAVPGVLLSRAAVETNKVRQQSLTDADQWIRASDAMLGHVTDALQRTCDIGITAQRVALGDAVKTALSTELRDLREHLIALGNSLQGDKYLFAGRETKTKPFEVEADGSVSYHGDGGQLLVSVAPGRTIPYNVSGDRVFNMGGATDPARPDVFEALDRMATAIETGSPQETIEATRDVQALLEAALNQRAATGVAGQRVQWATSYVTDEVLRSKTYLAEVEGADLADTIIDYRSAEVAYQATLYATDRVASLPTLFQLM